MEEIKNIINIAIDGPSGAGKSSVSKLVAKKIGFLYLDTGAIYRNLAYYFLQKGLKQEKEFNYKEKLKKLNLKISYVDGKQEIRINNVFFDEYIRTDEISKAASFVSRDFFVREFVLKIEREFAKINNVIMDGRDIGTVVLPQASLKIFLTASLDVRAKRRFNQLKLEGLNCEFSKVLKDMEKRDFKDSNRKIAPLKVANDAIVLNTSSLNLHKTVELVVDLIKSKVLEV